MRVGARLIGTNDDATYPTPDGPIPGGGALLAAVAKASGSTPVVAGKPYEPMADLVRAEVGGARRRCAVMIGDRQETDGDFAAPARHRLRAGALGRHRRPAAVVDPPPMYDAPDLARSSIICPSTRSPAGTAPARGLRRVASSASP